MPIKAFNINGFLIVMKDLQYTTVVYQNKSDFVNYLVVHNYPIEQRYIICLSFTHCVGVYINTYVQRTSKKNFSILQVAFKRCCTKYVCRRNTKNNYEYWSVTFASHFSILARELNVMSIYGT